MHVIETRAQGINQGVRHADQDSWNGNAPNATAWATHPGNPPELGVAADFEHVTQMEQIMAYPIMTTPALVVDEQVKCSGRIASKDELRGLARLMHRKAYLQQCLRRAALWRSGARVPAATRKFSSIV
jgi:hypothetical protein